MVFKPDAHSTQMHYNLTSKPCAALDNPKMDAGS